MMMPVFKDRSTQEEIMDDLDIHGEELNKTLNELDAINHWLGGNAVTISGLKKLLRDKVDEPVYVADLGCGGGGMMRLLSRWAARRKREVHFFGLDANAHIVNFARDQSAAYENLHFKQLDVLDQEFDNHSYDIVLATLFFHHFTHEQLVTLFKKLKKIATTGIVVNDLHRHLLAYYGFKLVSSLFSRSGMVKNDGLISVLRGFKKQELEQILAKADIRNYKIAWKWAFRWQLIIYL